MTASQDSISVATTHPHHHPPLPYPSDNLVNINDYPIRLAFLIPALSIIHPSKPRDPPLQEQPIFAKMALDNYYQNKIEAMKLEILKGQAVLRRLEAQRNDYNSRVRLLREELGLLQQPGSYVGEVVKVMGTKKVLVKVHPEGKYGE